MAPAVLLVTGAIILILAIPAYLLLRVYWPMTWPRCVAAGFLIGVIAAACVLLPVSGFVQIGQEVAVDGGVRTSAGWRMFAEAVSIAGGIGAGAATVFWAALRLLERGARWPRLGWTSLTAGISLVIAASWTIVAIPSLRMDRSCHNLFRDGRRTIAPVLHFVVESSGEEWTRFQDVAESFATNERWAVDESNDQDKGFSLGRFVDACVEPGTNIRFEGTELPGPRWFSVSVFQPQGGDSWVGPARRLLASVETAFPGRLRRSFFDKKVQTPATLLP